MNKTHLTWEAVVERLDSRMPVIRVQGDGNPFIAVYGVPRGGMLAAAALTGMAGEKECRSMCHMVFAPEDADVFVDDIIDSGRTRDKYRERFPDTPFIAAVDKTMPEDAGMGWVVFPWEEHLTADDAPSAIVRILEHIGEDPRREGLLETPERVVRSWKELYGGYGMDPASVLKVFEEGACREMVLLKDVEFYSTCEHHMLPFHGKAHIAYIPDGRVAGVSKLARLLEVFARRLQIQERLGQQVTKALMEHLKPLGAACILEAQHMCMTGRGVAKQHSVMVTSSLEGVFMSKPEVRAELMGLIR